METTALVAQAALALSVTAFLLGVVALVRLRRLRAVDGRGGGRRLRTAGDDAERLGAELAAVRQLAATGLSRVATVRYDAFSDTGGQLSFSVALLDEHADGLVLTAINSRATSRTYAKPVTGGAGAVELSDEEHAAVRQAMARSGRSVGAVAHAS